MRDDHLMQEKIEVSLERRHVALLAACALVLLGGVFALGVLVGRQLASAALAGPVKPAAGDLPALDAQKEELPPLRTTPASAAPASAAQVSLGQVSGAQASAAQPTAAQTPSSPPVSAASVAGNAAAAAPAAPARGTPGRGPVVVVPAARVASIPSAKPVDKAASQLALSPPPRDLGRFTVQLGASQDRAEAQRLEARSRASGLRPYVVEANLGAKGVWYRVRVGAFATRDAAERFRKDVERELRGSAAVMPSH